MSLRGLVHAAARGIAAAGLGVAIVFIISSGHAVRAQGDGGPAGDPVRGAVLAAACIECHGADGMGFPEGMPRIVGQSTAYLAAQIRLFRQSAQMRAGAVDEGEGMAHLKSTARSFSGKDSSMLGLSEQDIADVATYYGALQCKPSGKPPVTRPAIAIRCESCHGVGGTRTTTTQPSLASQNAVYLRRQLKLFRAAKSIGEVDLLGEGAVRYNRIMFTQSRWLTDDMIGELAVYFESVACE